MQFLRVWPSTRSAALCSSGYSSRVLTTALPRRTQCHHTSVLPCTRCREPQYLGSDRAAPIRSPTVSIKFVLFPIRICSVATGISQSCASAGGRKKQEVGRGQQTTRKQSLKQSHDSSP